MDSFSKGVDSPESIASFTIQVPLTRRTSAGTVVSVLTRANYTNEKESGKSVS